MNLIRHKKSMILMALLLVVFLCVPSIIKVSHALNGHKNATCSQIGKLHVHEAELDCLFHDFNLSPIYAPPLVYLPKPMEVGASSEMSFYYTFLSKYQKSHFELRGPPMAS